jgi:histidinol phosphatase-like PHP family hydrolase
VPPADPNLAAAALLYDMAALQPTERSQLGYKRAARAMVTLPLSVTELVASGGLTDVPFVGPSSARVIAEFVREGRSPTVEAALAASGRASKVLAARELRGRFLSEHAMQAAHALSLPPSMVSRTGFRGDLQMHSTWSDGAERIAAMAEACISLGQACMGVTDHSHGLPIARGISMESALKQQQEIDELNAGYRGRFRIFKGIEANIHADGSLDLSLEERRAFEYVVAAPHALLRRTEDQTGRMLAAVEARGVAILGHPRGRVYSSRGGVIADWRRVFEAAAARQVAIEIDGNWHRQDIDWELAAVALEAGCIFALDSDAHSARELRFTDYAIAHARLARIPADRVVNCWTDDRLEQWMADRHREPKRPASRRKLERLRKGGPPPRGNSGKAGDDRRGAR